ncbi:MAG: glycosyltransferase [Candidatus Omnitrophica bacterium]|nr:glycosyltransferase [Candidatus Omnitrophota bacterium]
MMLSIVIPVHNEEDSVKKTVTDIIAELDKAHIKNEIIIIDDNSIDSTPKVIADLTSGYPNIKSIRRNSLKGFGGAIREGLMHVNGDVVATVMGDLSDDPRDIVRYFRKIEEGYDCVFGSRFIKGSVVKDYPGLKLLINRVANNFVRILFWVKPNDLTNGFKMYKTEVINAIQPLQALYFNITIEIPLKAIVRGFSYTQIPISWYGRKSGVSKLGIRQMGRKYLFTVLYIWLEKMLLKDEVNKFAKEQW